MIPKSGDRFSDKIMRKTITMIPKSGDRFWDKIMLKPIIANRSSQLDPVML